LKKRGTTILKLGQKGQFCLTSNSEGKKELRKKKKKDKKTSAHGVGQLVSGTRKSSTDGGVYHGLKEDIGHTPNHE